MARDVLPYVYFKLLRRWIKKNFSEGTEWFLSRFWSKLSPRWLHNRVGVEWWFGFLFSMLRQITGEQTWMKSNHARVLQVSLHYSTDPSTVSKWRRRIEELFICHIHNYTPYNQQWNLCSAFNPSKCTHTWSSGQPTIWHPGSSRGFGALLKGLTSVVDNSCQSQDSNTQPRVTSPTLYPLEATTALVES